MRSLVVTLGPLKVDEGLADLAEELEIEAEDEPRLAPFLPAVEEKRAAVEETSKVLRKASAKGRVAGRRVKREDKGVKRSAAAVAKVLEAYKDEPGVAAVIAQAFPVSATEGTAGFADEKQARFVRKCFGQRLACGPSPARWTRAPVVMSPRGCRMGSMSAFAARALRCPARNAQGHARW